MGRSDSRLSNRRNRPIGKPYWSPTHGAPGAKVHDAFPPFPPTKIKIKINKKFKRPFGLHGFGD